MANDEEIRLEAIFATVALRTQRRCSFDNRGRIGRHHLLRAFKPCWLRNSMRSSTDDWAIIIRVQPHLFTFYGVKTCTIWSCACRSFFPGLCISRRLGGSTDSKLHDGGDQAQALPAFGTVLFCFVHFNAGLELGMRMHLSEDHSSYRVLDYWCLSKLNFLASRSIQMLRDFLTETDLG